MKSVWIDFGDAEPVRFDNKTEDERAAFIDGVKAAKEAWWCNTPEFFLYEPSEVYVPEDAAT